ncbi:mechanosensitive ion channel family protein [Methanoplanus sp. FWC-SCC4]|uniref:Mechanosensitive ion channel family protein n=1 Tax=Methanochimaera problematica TaxID=2609417 RepID=A0AA97FES9_9EURY|nr:mechanosensitive ion channel family protein [Methanoplanus sp. FWC-SCC4]WOF16718.1 mechanosensitive ion channel family protein [Methanoplanus sp. FWC-SCC4]
MAEEFSLNLNAINFGALFSLSLGNLILALATLILGYIIVRFIGEAIRKSGEKNLNIPALMMIQIARAIKFVLYVLVILLALAFLNFDVAGIIIAIGAFLGLILGFGMKDTVNNIASGLWISATKAYDIDDEVTVSGLTGLIVDMNLLATELKQIDNARAIIPNGNIWNSPIINYTKMPIRMLILNFGISYDSSVPDAVNAAVSAAKKHSLVHGDPEPAVKFLEMAESSVNLQLRVWVNTPDYYQVKSELMNMLYDGLNTAGVKIPYPHVELVKE